MTTLFTITELDIIDVDSALINIIAVSFRFCNVVDFDAESAEVMYQRERNPAHGFGHKPSPEGIHDWGSNECEEGCRFYESAGRLTLFDILEDYRGYQQFEDVWRAYKELEKDGSLPTE